MAKKLPLANFTGLNQDVFDKASTRDKVAIAIQFAEHATAEAECHAFGQKIADMCGCRLIKASMKSLVRADQKVGSDYQGDWSKVKDLVRMTILARNTKDLTHVGPRIRMMATAPWCVLKDEEAKKETDACGYSGLNFVLQKNKAGSVGVASLGQALVAPPADAKGISNAQWAKTVRMEIQANIPEIIYGKESEEDFVNKLGESGRTSFEKIKDKCKIVGGLGHVFYEISKAEVDVTVQNTAKSLSKRYYEYLRAPQSFSSPQFIRLCHDLTPFVQENEKFFRKHPVRSISLAHLPTPATVTGTSVKKLKIPGAFGK